MQQKINRMSEKRPDQKRTDCRETARSETKETLIRESNHRTYLPLGALPLRVFLLLRTSP